MRDLALSREKFPCDAVEQKEGTRKQSKQFGGGAVGTVVGKWVLFRCKIHGRTVCSRQSEGDKVRPWRLSTIYHLALGQAPASIVYGPDVDSFPSGSNG